MAMVTAAYSMPVLELVLSLMPFWKGGAVAAFIFNE